MANSGKRQKFPYSYKAIAIPVNAQFVFNKPTLEIINPVNLFEVELLYTHIRILFDSSINASLKKLLSVTVTGLDANGNVVRSPQGLSLNKSAVSDIIDVSLDLSPFVYKSGRNQISFEVPSNDQYGGLTGTNILQIWKADMAYTVKGIY